MNSLSAGDILIIVLLVVGVIGAGLYFLNRWASKKQVDQQQMMDQNRQQVTIYAIDKKKTKPSENNLPKAALSQLPKYYKFLKLYFVKAKVGPQIVTLMCDKNVFEAIPLKKNIKVEVAGIYIMNVKGMKTKAEIKAIAKEKKKNKKDAK